MTITDTIKAIAGFLISGSLILGYTVNDKWFFLALFVGLNLFQSSITKWCLMEKILKKVGLKNN